MNRIILLAVLIFSGSAYADGCKYVEGTWRIDRFDNALQAQVEIELVFAEDGVVRAVSHANDGVESKYYEDWGEWSCANDVIEVSWRGNRYGLEDGEVVYFELQEANNSYMAIKEIRENTDVPARRQAIRVSESSYIHCC